VSESPVAARHTIFAAMALLRGRERLAPLLEAVAEPRRSELARAVAQHEQLDDTRLKQALAEVIRREHAAVRDTAAQLLGSSIVRVPRVVRLWLAREAEQ